MSTRKVISDISWMICDKFLEYGVTIFVGILMARYLGPENLGVLHYALAFIAICVPFSQLGLYGIVVRSIVNTPEQANRILGTALSLQLMVGLFVVILINAYVWVFRDASGVRSAFISILSFTILLRSTDVVKWWNQSQTLQKYTVIANRTGMLIAAAIKLFLIWQLAPLEAFVWAWIIHAVVGAVLLLFIFQSVYKFLQDWRFDLQVAKELLSNSWPLLFTSVASIVYLQIDKVMLGNMVNNYEVGIYAVASRVSELGYFMPTIIVGSLFPAIIKTKKLRETLFETRIQSLMDLLALYSYAVMAFFWVLGGFLITLLYGEKYTDSIEILRVHLFALLFVATGVARNRSLIAEDKTRFIMFSTILGAVVNVALNIYLIPLYGGLGAAWATVISYGVSTFGACFLVPSMRKMARILACSYLVPLRPKLVTDYTLSKLGLRSVSTGS